MKLIILPQKCDVQEITFPQSGNGYPEMNNNHQINNAADALWSFIKIYVNSRIFRNIIGMIYASFDLQESGV